MTSRVGLVVLRLRLGQKQCLGVIIPFYDAISARLLPSQSCLGEALGRGGGGEVAEAESQRLKRRDER